MVAKDYQDPVPNGVLLGAPGRVRLRSSHLQVITLSPLEKWKSERPLSKILKTAANLEASGAAVWRKCCSGCLL